VSAETPADRARKLLEGASGPWTLQVEPDYGADTTETRLHLRDGAWYVERPARPCCRAVVIAADAIRDGAEPPPGILPEEVEKAREILASDDPRAWAWAASGGWGLLEWPLPAVEATEAEELVSRRGKLGCDDI